MAHSNNWDETNPTDSSNAVDVDNEIRKVRLDTRERLAIDHKFSSSDDADDAYGIHKKVTFEDHIASPTLASNQKCLYPKTGDYDAELRYKDERAVDSLISFVGEIRMRLGTAVPDGWLALNGDSIGSATSGATHAGDNYKNLYYFLYANLADAEFPVAGGRVDVDTDWTANKKGTMPDARSRVPICAGQGSGLTSRTIGAAGGGETKDVSHDHTVDSHTHGVGTLALTIPYTGWSHTSTETEGRLRISRTGSNEEVATASKNTSGGSGVTEGTTPGTSTDGSSAQDVMNPWLAVTMVIKY